MDDLISRQAAIDAMANTLWHYPNECYRNLNACEFAKDLAELGLKSVPSAQPERLTDDDFETIRIHLSAIKEGLCNQHRWKEAEEYQHIIDRFMAFASAQPERKKGKWFNYQGNTKIVLCSECRMPALESMTGCLANQHLAPNRTNFCPNCGADMREEKNDD